MGTKFGKSEFPDGHGPDDFQCMGPVATVDGQFDGVYMADMGCFLQPDGEGRDVDSNKYYHAAVVQGKSTKRWFFYTEWGRVGAKNPQFQFEEFSDKDSAQKAFAAQCHKKNDKRGIWKDLGGIKALVAKPGDDVYKVQSLESRSTGLPDAKTITAGGGIDPAKIKTVAAITSKRDPKTSARIAIDGETNKLLKDLRVGAVTFTRSTLEGGNVPSMPAITEGRSTLVAALNRIAIVGDNLDDQVNDKDLRDLTSHIYSKIPKKKDQRVGPEKWILSKDNIMTWQQDLDAFENAIYANVEVSQPEENPYGDLPIQMKWLPPDDELGKFIRSWMPGASLNRHSIGNMVIKNVWKVQRHGDDKLFQKGLERCRVTGTTERPICQPSERPDLDRETLKRFVGTNTALLFHGTRSVNVPGILRTNLRFPKDLPKDVVISGAMFGPGAYFADDWRKSAGYTSMSGSYYGGGGGAVAGRGAFMFLMDVALGKPFTAPGPRGYTSPPTGHHCVFGKAGHSQVQNNEWIVFERDQIQIPYLVEFETKSRW